MLPDYIYNFGYKKSKMQNIAILCLGSKFIIKCLNIFSIDTGNKLY